MYLVYDIIYGSLTSQAILQILEKTGHQLDTVCAYTGSDLSTSI